MEKEKKQPKPRREKGTGRVFRRKIKRKDGTYYYSKKYYLEHTVNNKKKTISLDCENERKAKQKAASILKPVKEANTKEQIAVHIAEARNILKRNRIKIENTWEKYLQDQGRPDSGESTLIFYERMFNRFKNWIKDNHPSIIYLSQVTNAVSLEYAAWLWDKGISAKTFNSHIGALRLITQTLSKQGSLDANPWDKSVIPRKNEIKISRKEFSEQQVIDILDAFDDPGLYLLNKNEMRVMFHLGAWTGLRLIDCALMKWESIDLDRNIINCIPQKTRKTLKSVIILLHPMLKERLDEALKWQTNEYVLPAIADRYERNPVGVRKDALKVLTHIKLETTQEVENGNQRKLKANVYGFHSFRHSFVSFCAKAGVPLPVVQSIVGHGNPAITRHYIHIGEESTRNAINALPMATEEKESADAKLKAITELLEKKKRLSENDRIIIEIISRELPEKSPENTTEK